jgi:hypothetical protein
MLTRRENSNGSLNCISDQIVEGKHPVGLDAVRSQDHIHL